MATIKKLYFANGTDVTTPADLSFESSTNRLETYADDAAFVTANGAAAEGDIYLNTTLEAPRAYLGGAWRTALMSNDAADATKQVAFNLTGATAARTQTLVFVGTDNRSYTFPDYNGRVAINTGTETAPVLFSGATGNLDIGNASGTVRIVGNLEVQGTTTTLNTQTVQVEDNNILVNYGGSDITAQGSGLQVQRTGTAGSLIYDSAAATKWKAGDLGAEIEIADKSTAQALTNKTIDGSLNTISNLTSAMVTGTIAPSKGGTGISNNDAATLTRSGNHAVTLTTTNTTSVTLPTSGTLATLAGTEVLTNKDHDGGTASDTSRFTIPKATKTTLDALTRKEATMVYGTDTKKLYVDYDSTLNEIGGGAGGGTGRNYLQAWYTGLNPITSVSGLTSTGNRASNQTIWGTTSGTDFEAVNNTTLPLRESGDIKLDSKTTTVGAFVESPMFTLDRSDLGSAISIAFDITGNTADGNYDIVVIRYNSSGTYQETISVAGNASAGTPASAKLPTGTTVFKGFFIAGATAGDLYSIRFRKLLAVNVDMQIDSLFVGPQSLAQGAVVTAWQNYTPSTPLGITLGNGTQIAAFRRVGDSAQIRYNLVFGSTTAITALVDLINIAPPSTTFDFTFLATANRQTIGTASCFDSDADIHYTSTVRYDPSIPGIRVASTEPSISGISSTRPFTWTTADVLTVDFEMKISQWSSSTTTLADRAVEEYAFNTSTSTTASDTASFGYGSQGAQIQNISASLTRRVRFTTPILSTDNIVVEISTDQSKWFPVSGSGAVVGSTWVQSYRNEVSTRYGLGRATIINSTDVDIDFGQFCANLGASFGAAGTAWSAGAGAAYWRCRKVQSGASVGYPVSARNLVGDTSGSVVPSGLIGEIISSKTSAATNVTTAVYFDAVTITLTSSGTYRLDSSVRYTLNGATVSTWQGELFFGTTTGNNSTGLDLNENYWNVPSACTSAADCSINATQVINYNSATGVVTFSSGATMTLTGGVLRLKSRPGGFTGGPIQHRSFLTATRIA